MEKDYLLTIDAGTTSVRGVLFDHQGQIVARSIKKIQQSVPHPGWLEQDPNALYDAVQTVLADTLIQGHATADNLTALAIANQRETTIIWDKQSGQPVYPAIVWRSNQTQAIIDEYKNQLDSQLIRQKTGLRLDPIFSASKIRFILDQVPDGQAKAENGDLLFGTVNTWLSWKLSGGAIFATDNTNASRTLLFNINTLDWDETLLTHFNIPRAILPRVVANDVILGDAVTGQFSGHPVPIAAMVGSQQAALIGQTAFDPGMVKATLGSGGFIVMNVGTDPKLSANHLLTSVGYSLNATTHYVLEGGILTAGDAIDWFVDKLQFLSSFQDAAEAVQKATSDNELYFVPAFSGLAAPYWDPDVRGAFLGLTRGSTKDDLVKAGLQSIAYQTADILNTMTQDTNLPIAELRVDGGATRNDYLLQFLADMAQLPVQRSQSQETTALGAAFIAGLNTGCFSDLANLRQLNKGGQIFEPQLDAQSAKRLLSGWHQAIAAAQAFE